MKFDISRLKELRQQSGKTQKQVADEIGLHAGGLSRAERGEIFLQYPNLERYLDCIGYELHVKRKRQTQDVKLSQALSDLEYVWDHLTDRERGAISGEYEYYRKEKDGEL